MTKRERVEAVYSLQKADRIPFVPAIYEHKGALIGKSPSQICRNANYLYAGLLRELEVYDPDLLVIGIDVYNVEAEALGCEVVYFDQSNDCPGIVTPILDGTASLGRLGLADPESAGRMPLYLEVAGRLQAEIGGSIILRGAVTGPYSMASELIGAEKFVLLTVDQPVFARKILDFCASMTVEFGRAFLRRGVEPIIFDSRATPAMASPRIFRSMVQPVYREFIFPELKAAGGRYLPLIIGGNTTPIIDDLIETGATQFLADHPANIVKWCQKALAARVPVRANVDALLVNRGPASAVRRQAVEILKQFHNQPGFLLGCGVVAYDGDPEFAHAIRRVLDDLAANRLDFERELSLPA
ncbi:MAG: uroporphyrinogen decarboxylase family protein [Terracidiphilus sp.]|jgi:uroporphyrinogen decarboxylase